ncbi:putative reverse transcriptase domain-containing protein [Tanacetum coccineum]
MAPGRRPTIHRNPPVNRLTDRNNVDINSGIDTQVLNQLIATRVAEALAAAVNKACNYKEFRAVMHENFHGTEGAVGLTRWFEKLESQFGISNVAEGDKVKFASSTLLDRHKAKDWRAPPCLANQRGPGSQGGQGSDVTCFGCGEKGHYKNRCPNNGSQGGGNQIQATNKIPQTIKRQNQGNPKGNKQASTSTQGERRVTWQVYSLCTEAAVKDNNCGNAKIEAVKNWASPTTPLEIRQFLGLAGYYRRFIERFSKIAKPVTELMQKIQKFDWGKEQEEAFQLLKQKLCAAPILALPEGSEDFVVYCDASIKGLVRSGSVRPEDLETLFIWHEVCSVHRPQESTTYPNLKGKANIVVDALSRKERIEPLRERALVMTIGLDLPSRILEAQKEAVKVENIEVGYHVTVT